MAFAQAIGVNTQKPTWNMPFGEDERHWLTKNVATDKPFVVISAAASKAERNWTVQGYAQAADYLIEKGYNVLLCGGPTALEKLLASDIINNTQHELINMVGKTNLKQLLAALEQAKLVIAPDTGPAHMATTVSTPVIGLYAHSNPKGTGLSLVCTMNVYLHNMVSLGQNYHGIPVLRVS